MRRMQVVRSSLLVGAGILALVFGGCRSQAPDEASARVLRIALPSPPVSLDPHLQDERATQSMLGHIFEGLTAFDEDMRLRPSLAESWENPTDTSWRFRLREGVLFHNGRVLVADDVVASIERARRHPESQVGGFLVSIAEVRRVDDRTVEISTNGPAPLLAARLSFIGITPAGVPARIEQPVGTGPWVFDRWEQDRLELLPFPSHRGGRSPWSRVEIHFIEAGSERAARLLDGAVDVATMIPLKEEAALTAAGLTLVSRAGLAVTFLGLRVDVPPFDRLVVRQAIDRAIDRERIVAGILGGRGLIANQPTSPAVFGHAPGLTPTPHDPESSRLQLQEALTELERAMVFELEHPPGLEREAAAIAEDLTAVGLSTVPRTRPWPELYRRLSEGKAALFLAGYGCDSGAASDLLDAALHSRDPERGYGDTNFMGYADPALDRLIELANRTFDERSRRALLEQASRHVATNLPVVPLWINESSHALQPGLSWRPRLDRRVYAHEISTRSDGE